MAKRKRKKSKSKIKKNKNRSYLFISLGLFFLLAVGLVALLKKKSDNVLLYNVFRRKTSTKTDQFAF